MVTSDWAHDLWNTTNQSEENHTPAALTSDVAFENSAWKTLKSSDFLASAIILLAWLCNQWISAPNSNILVCLASLCIWVDRLVFNNTWLVGSVNWKKEKKKAQHESCKLNFIGNKMRTIAQETGPQQVWGTVQQRRGRSVHMILVRGDKHTQADILAEAWCKSWGINVSYKTNAP